MNKYIIIVVALLLIILVGVILFGGNTQERGSGQLSPEDMQGIHIMPDGAVMNGEGEVIEGAIILEDNTIRLPNSIIVTPVNDFRR